ncbi:hypothetical protein FRB91_011308 [Serendipita sp. 411]|nr:hypothetical protein FRB91_011308 [Serendipita sp. 411]
MIPHQGRWMTTRVATWRLQSQPQSVANCVVKSAGDIPKFVRPKDQGTTDIGLASGCYLITTTSPLNPTIDSQQIWSPMEAGSTEVTISRDKELDEHIKQATEDLVKLFDEKIGMLDKLVATYWREMVEVKSDLDLKTLEGLSKEDKHRETVARYQRKVDELQKKLEKAEEVIRERDEEIKRLKALIPKPPS